MIAQVGIKKAGRSTLVRENKKGFFQGLTLLATQWQKDLSVGLIEAWFECFQNVLLETWGEGVQYWLANFDHFPLPIEMRRIIENIEKEKIKTITKTHKSLGSPRALLSDTTQSDYSEEYRQANLEFLNILTSGLGQCLKFKDGETKSKEERKEIWKDTEAKVATLQNKYQHLPSSYACTKCWDSGWVAKPESGYMINYPCRCAKGFDRQKEIILSALNDKAKQIKQTLSQYLASLTTTPFHMKAYPCIAVFTAEGRWDFACQNQCAPERIKWCFLKIDTIMVGIKT